jgi:hypothetical protein
VSSSKFQLAPATSSHLTAPPLSQDSSASLAPRSTGHLFDSSSGNTVNDSHVNVAARDVINCSVFINAPPPLTTPSQQTPVIPKVPDQPVFQWPSIRWKFWTPFAGTAVTLYNPEPTTVDSLPKPQATISISPDPTDSQPLMIQQAPAAEAHLSQANTQVHCKPYPSENESNDNSPQPGDTRSDIVSICTTTFLHSP